MFYLPFPLFYLLFQVEKKYYQPHDSDVKALIRLGVAWNILIACDRSTADFILTSSLMMDEYEIIIPDYNNYINRKKITQKAG